LSYLCTLMSFLHKHIILRYLWVLMALHVLNCSIDTPDVNPDSVPENLSYNDIESISELLIEEVMGFENAIAEHEERDTEDGGSIEVGKILFFCQSSPEYRIKPTLLFVQNKAIPLTYEANFIPQFQPDIVSPPPQQA
jgi:hypothetical protein